MEFRFRKPDYSTLADEISPPCLGCTTCCNMEKAEGKNGELYYLGALVKEGGEIEFIPDSKFDPEQEAVFFEALLEIHRKYTLVNGRLVRRVEEVNKSRKEIMEELFREKDLGLLMGTRKPVFYPENYDELAKKGAVFVFARIMKKCQYLSTNLYGENVPPYCVLVGNELGIKTEVYDKRPAGCRNYRCEFHEKLTGKKASKVLKDVFRHIANNWRGYSPKFMLNLRASLIKNHGRVKSMIERNDAVYEKMVEEIVEEHERENITGGARKLRKYAWRF